MSDTSSIHARLLNPLRFHHQKLGLELNCPICLSLLDRPVLLPCDHIFCNACIPKSSQFRSDCSLCKQQYNSQDVRHAPYMENIVTIYKSLNATFRNYLFQPHTPDAGKVHQGSPVSIDADIDNKPKDPAESPLEGNSSNGQSTFTYTPKKRVRASLDSSLELENKCAKKIEKSLLPRSSNHEEYKLNGIGMGLSGMSKVFLPQHPDQLKGAEFGMELRDIYQGLDGNCNGPGSSDDIKSGECCYLKGPENLNSFDSNRSICTFCQSSEVTDRTGLMLHYVKGKEVQGEAATDLNAIHVHKACIEWTPQAYFVGEIVKNLKGEIARAAKLKCSHCGLKGAALGCFMKSCRKTYHVPCAVDIPDCRWDPVDFLMLCPSHSSVKFPREKSKSGKRARERQHSMRKTITSEQSTQEDLPLDQKRLVFCGSALSSEEKYLLVKFASQCGAAVTKFWNPDVTHVVAATDSNGACVRSLKVLKAILHGRWILKTDWIKASMPAGMQPVDEEPYEVCLDNHGCCDGPKMGRLRALNNAPKLFDGLNFYFTGDFIPAYKDNLLDLVISAGGTIIKSKEELVAKHDVGQTTSSTDLVVFNSDCMQEEDRSVVFYRSEAAKNLAKELGCEAIDHTWLLESIASCKCSPFNS